MRKSEEHAMMVTEMRMLRWMTGKTKLDKVRNDVTRRILKVPPISVTLRNLRLIWYGHVQRREHTYVAKVVDSMEVDGRRPRGLPKLRWMDVVRGDMSERGLTGEMVNDRVEWRKRARAMV